MGCERRNEICLEDVKFHLENAESRENLIILNSEFFNSLLKCLGLIAALLDSGKIYEARELLGELGEAIYQSTNPR
jgi:hypothetical protein